MRKAPFPFVGGAYADESRPWSMQDTVNYLPTLAERSGTRSQAMLKTPPGLKPYQKASGAGVVRGTYEAEGKFFAVIGTTFYRCTNTGVLIPLGSVPGLGRVAFTHNQISLGNEVVVVNGTAGYVYNTVTDAFGRITDPGYPGSAVAGFIDGYILGIEPQGRYAFNSRPAAATDYNTLDRFTSEVSPDRLVTQGISNNELLLLSTTSGEFFQNTGASQQPFRSKRITMDKGCAGPHTLVDLDNSLCWLGGDGVFYRLENYTPKRISTRPIEQAIRGLDWWQAFGFVWEDSGYACAYWTFPDGRTWGWDAANGEWHRRESYGMERWRASTMTRWNKRWFAGDFQGPRLYVVDWDYPWEYQDEFVSERTCPVMSDNQNLVKARRLELVMDTGQLEVDPIEFPEQPVGPTITGEAPDGSTVAPYPGYTYTLTPGSSPIVRTIITAGALPAGLAWDEDTASISATTPTQTGEFTISLRTYDANGLYDDHIDTILIAIAWLAIPSHGAGNGDLKPAPNGLDWTSGVAYNSAAITQDGTPRLYYGNNGTCFYANQNSPSSKWAISTDLVNFTNLTGSGPTPDATGAASVYASGFWHVCQGTTDGMKIHRYSDAGAWDTVGTAPMVKRVARGENNLCAIYHTNNGPHYTAPLNGSVWTNQGNITGGNAVGPEDLAGSPEGEFGYLLIYNPGGGAQTPKLWRSTDDGVTFVVVTCPLPDATGGNAVCRIRYDATLGLWLLTAGTRICYGPTLANLSLSEHVAPGVILDIGSDGLKFVICGSWGFEATVDGIDFDTLSTNLTNGALSLTSLGMDT